MVWSKQSNLVVLSSPVKVDLAIYKGDTGSFKITVTDEDGAPVNISGHTFDGDIRLTPESVSPVTTFTITPVGGDTSSIDVLLTATNSNLLTDDAPYYYDIEMKLGAVVTTLVGGLIYVTQDVSRT